MSKTRSNDRNSSGKNLFQDPFLEGNELIETAIEHFYAEGSRETLVAVLDAIRTRMHADGHLIFPVAEEDDGKKYSLCALKSQDGKLWQAAFTSQAEYEKGEHSQVLSHFIDSTLRSCLDSDLAGVVINPWGRSFQLTKELIGMIFKADGGLEYSVPDVPITAELLEDGSFLKKAVEICNRNRTPLNVFKLLNILRDSWVWIPCETVLGDGDYETVLKDIKEAEAGDGLDSMIGKEFRTQEDIRFVPDILKGGDDYYFPAFTSEEEMGEYGQNFSRIQQHFLEAINLAKNNKKKVVGIVINAFSEPFVINKELFGTLEEMESSLKEKEE